MISHHIKTAITGGALLIALLAASMTPAAALSGTCNATLTKYMATHSAAQTNSGSAVEIPAAKFTITQGHAGCVLVRFTAITYAANSIDTVEIFATIDGSSSGSYPSQANFPEETSIIGHSHTVEFLFSNVPAGDHVVAMKWKNPKGNMIYMPQHLMVVNYTK